ncbi:CaiB/BaiF CoA transferase family protein [Cumulibacter soli]|uniref:CaiB/BaiF CoA transferase family protein n=1 Tax=Cumulibacter soli TaxID=2546344 RepID=UPI001067FB82|nr:CoA transferase [Cumulibacter soli]
MNGSEPTSLEGIRVLELTHAIAGPQCGQILADHGADVIKIEPPNGEIARASYPRDETGESIYFSCHNRGKRSVVIDLKTESGLANFKQMVAVADIVLTNYTVDVPARLGWDYESLKALNPALIMVHVTGFGTTGTRRDMRALDGIIQAMSGIPYFSGTPDSGPTLAAAFIADHVAAYHAALAAMFALVRRQRSGVGAFVDLSMLQAFSASLAHEVQTSLTGKHPQRIGNRVASSFINTFDAKDGVVILSPIGEAKWAKLCRAIGHPELPASISYEQAIFERRDEAEKLVGQWCAVRSRDEIVEQLAAAGIPCGPVQSPSEYANAALADGTGTIVEVTSPNGRTFNVPGPVAPVGLSDSSRSRTVPRIGEHTAEVLAEFELTEAGI